MQSEIPPQLRAGEANGRFMNGRLIKGRQNRSFINKPLYQGQASGRNGRFINEKPPNGQMFRFGLRMADFILSRTSSLSAARPSHYQRLAKRINKAGRQWPFYQSQASVAVLSQGPGQWPRWPFYQQEAAKWPDLQIWVADGRFHIAPYKQFISGQADQTMAALTSGRFMKPASRMAVLSRPANPMADLPKQAKEGLSGTAVVSNGSFTKPGKLDGRFIKAGQPNGRFIKANGRFIKAL
ncbi:MAG: hypothetical protein NXI08_17125 [bacterium]|nr:hypothetical protein [bacterium]